ncbi:MAG: alpha/beta hydrolase-fold protein [Chryseolinea sp.]
MKTLLLIISLTGFFNFSSAQTKGSGEIKGPFQWNSKIYPGTHRQFWIYVPRQYDAAKPACLMVVQDGLSRANDWKLPHVLDSLIDSSTIPVMIGVFIDHGAVLPTTEGVYPRYNRSFEYDALGDRYARFLIEEILPEVQRSYNISQDPNDRCIAGASSGAICAFNVAWERPDQFRRVLSTIGTYVGLRDADELITLVRKTEAKPLRIFLEDGSTDLNIYAGDWWMANQAMLSSLKYAGYEVNHTWGSGGHDSKHAVSILPDALAWLWKDYPEKIKTHRGIEPKIKLLIEGEDWKRVSSDEFRIERFTINDVGEVVFPYKQSVYTLSENNLAKRHGELEAKGSGTSSAPNGLVYVSLPSKRKIVSISVGGIKHEVVDHCTAEYLCSTDKGLYFIDTNANRIGFYRFTSKKVQYITTPFRPVSLTPSAEKTFLNVGSGDSYQGYSYQILEDGALDNGQGYTHYHTPYDSNVSGQSGMTVDTNNLLYTATQLGVQVSDQLGRVNFIFSKPSENPMDVKLGGKDFNILYLSAGGKLYARRIAATGTHSWGAPSKPPKPGL